MKNKNNIIIMTRTIIIKLYNTYYHLFYHQEYFLFLNNSFIINYKLNK